VIYGRDADKIMDGESRLLHSSPVFNPTNVTHYHRQCQWFTHGLDASMRILVEHRHWYLDLTHAGDNNVKKGDRKETEKGIMAFGCAGQYGDPPWSLHSAYRAIFAAIIKCNVAMAIPRGQYVPSTGGFAGRPGQSWSPKMLQSCHEPP